MISTTDYLRNSFIESEDEIYLTNVLVPFDLLGKGQKKTHTLWHEQGLLREGNKINFKDVTEWFVEIQNELDIYIYKIGYDSWGSTYVTDELKSRISGKKVQCQSSRVRKPLNRMRADLSAKRINYNNNPILKWCMSNSAVTRDRNDNLALVKTSNSKRRIDGFASLMDAYIVYENEQQGYMSNNKNSVYEVGKKEVRTWDYLTELEIGTILSGTTGYKMITDEGKGYYSLERETLSI